MSIDMTLSKPHPRGTWLLAAALALGGLPALAAGPATAPATPASATAADPRNAPPLADLYAQRMARKKQAAQPIKRIDINGASKKELETLPGVDAALADKIIANRPYLSKAELVNKGVLPVGPYISIKKQIIALQKVKPKPKH